MNDHSTLQDEDENAPSWPNGRYIGEVVARWHADGRTMSLVQDFAYEDPGFERWDAPAGSVVDGASIPRVMWSIIGGPFEGMYRDASVIHDVACVARTRLWREVHEAFYFAMRASGVGEVQAKVMYAAVYHFGPRWPDPRKSRKFVSRNFSLPPVLSDADFERLRLAIEARGTGPSGMPLDEIQVFKPAKPVDP